MNKLRKRILITFFTLILVTGLGAAFWSYRNALAEDSRTSEIESVDMADPRPAGFTNIDYIIENACNTNLQVVNGFDPSVYHIVEISSGSLSLLSQFAVENVGTSTDATAAFRRVVLTLNRSNKQTKEMPVDKIEYLGFDTSTINTNDTVKNQAIAAISNADLLYISIDPDKVFDQNTGNDLNGDMKDVLNIYAMSNGKPIIIDSPTKTQEDNNVAISDFKSLCKIFYETGTTYNTFIWGSDITTGNRYTPAELFNRASGSLFMPIDPTLVKDGHELYKNWIQQYDSDGTYIYKTQNSTHDSKIANVLVVTAASSTDATPLADELKQGTKLTVSVPDGAVNPAVDANGDPIEVGGREAYTGTLKNIDVYPVAGTDLDLAYKVYSAAPDYIHFDTIGYDKSNPALDISALQKYDLILLEDSLANGVQLSDGSGAGANDFMTFVSLMYANQHIVFGPSLKPSNNNNSNIVVLNAPGFNEIYNRLVDSNDKRLYQNVLVCSRKDMNQKYADNQATASTEQPIVYIINNGAYRPSGSGEDSSDKFRVLELQPAYPVDLKLAAEFAKINDIYDGFEACMWGVNDVDSLFYYIDTGKIANVTTNMTKGGADEIYFDGNTSLSAMKDYTTGEFTAAGKAIIANANISDLKDYYAWELTPAKVKHILEQTTEFANYTVNQIEVVHMSTTQFQSSRVSLLDNYDLIYIGGDNSGIKELQYFRANSNGGDTTKANDNIGATNATYYNMYYHNGDLYEYSDGNGREIIHEGYVKDGIGVLYGNDITYDKLEELKKYVQSGMPVVVTSELTKAYSDMLGLSNKYTQHVIDPDSNMVKFLDTYYDNKPGEGKVANIIFDFNSKDNVRIPNPGGKYCADAKTGVTVFGGNKVEDFFGNNYTSSSTVNESDIVKMLNTKGVNYRPKFKMTSFPTSYNSSTPELMKTSALQSNTLYYEFDMISPSAGVTFSLYIDDNADSKFDESEKVLSDISATTGKFTYSVDDEFSGALYLQVTAEHTSGSKSSWRQICKIAPQGQKEQIDILQILPDTMYTKVGWRSDVTLYFCTECETSAYPFKGNHYAKLGKYTTDVMRGKVNGEGGFADGDSYMPDKSGLTAPTVQNGIASRDANSECKVTAGDKDYKYEGNLLGVHVHTFGIHDYDPDGGLDPDHDQPDHGNDNLHENLADQIEDDYDFNVNFMSTVEFMDFVDEVEGMYVPLSATDRTDLRDRYNMQAAKYEAFFKEMKMLINEDIEYVPAELYDIRRRVENVRGGGASDATLVSELNNLYTKYNIRRGSYTSAPDIFDDINSKLGINSGTEYSDFQDMLEEYGLTLTDHLHYETEMLQLGSNVPTIIQYSVAQNDMNDYCQKIYDYAVANGGLGDALRSDQRQYLLDDLQYYMKHHNYYDFYSLCDLASDDGKGPTLAGDTAKVTFEYGKYFMPWRDSMIFYKYFYDKYMEAKFKAAVDDDGHSLLNSVYSIIILGPANHFGYDDIDRDNSTDAIKRYADEGGKVLLYHDTIDTAKVGRHREDFSINLAQELRETFGMDARHLVVGASDADKDLISSRTIVADYGGTTFNIPVNQEKDLYYSYNMTFTAPSASSKIYIYAMSKMPTPAQEGSDSVYNLSDWTIKMISPSGGYAANTSSITGTIAFDGNNVYSSDHSSMTTATANGASTLNVNLNVLKQDYNAGWLPTEDTYYLVVCCSTNEPYLSQNKVLVNNSKVIPIKSGVATSAITGKATLTSGSHTSEGGNLSGFTSESNKQKLNICINAADLSSVLGSRINFTDSNGLSDSASFITGTYPGSSTPCAVATLEFDNWKLKSGVGQSFVPKGSYDPNKYFLSTLTTDGKPLSNGKPIVTTAVSTRTMASYTGYIDHMMNKSMYKFGMYDANAEDYYNESAQNRQNCLHSFKTTGKRAVTDEVGINNSGLLTNFPFKLPDKFRVTSTHPQAFDLDVEDPNMVVYFTTQGGTKGTMSHLLAADPYDGTENYFIYQYNSVYYCGAGHMNVTGFGTDNVEERKLYINVIVNSLHKSAIGPQLKLYDENATNDDIKNGTANAIIKPDGLGNYVLEVKDSNVTPAFSIKDTIDSTETIKRVRCWYDLDLENEQVNHPYEEPSKLAADHVLFYDTNGNGDDIAPATSDELQDFLKRPVTVNQTAKFTVGDMKLKQSYFDAYDGMHTYIVVCVTTERKGKTYNTYRKIRINLKPFMYDLT